MYSHQAIVSCAKVNVLMWSHTSTLCTKLRDEHQKLNTSTHLKVAAHTTHGEDSRAHRSGQSTVDSHHSVLLLGHNSHPDISIHHGDTLINGTTQASP